MLEWIFKLFKYDLIVSDIFNNDGNSPREKQQVFHTQPSGNSSIKKNYFE